MYGDSVGIQYGFCVGGVGDVNGDGYGDVAVSAVGYYYNVGRVYVYPGSRYCVLGNPPLAILDGLQAGEVFGASLAGAGDVNGDGFADLIVGAPHYWGGQGDEGAARVFCGGGQGVELMAEEKIWVPIQRPVDWGGMCYATGDPDAGVHIVFPTVNSPGGGVPRVREVVAHCELARADWDTTRGDWTECPPGVRCGPLSVGLSENHATPVRWRARIETNSPFFIHSRWVSFPGSVPTEWQFRFVERTSAVDPAAPGDLSPLCKLDSSQPNPFRSTARISYTVSGRADVTLAIYDPAGRAIRTLREGSVDAGTHAVIWDGRNEAGAKVASGVYMIRMRVGERSLSRKIILAR